MRIRAHVYMLATLLLGCTGDLSPRTRDGAAERLILLPDGPGGDRGLPVGDHGSADHSGVTPDKPPPVGVNPPLGGSSNGTGGGPAPGGTQVTKSGVTYSLVVPSSYSSSTPSRLMVVFSGTEGGAQMTQNLISVGSVYGLGDVIFAVLDGTTYFGLGQAGAVALDDVRARYNIDNDRTYLLGESAGTSAGLQLGLSLRQSYFAAYWANDVNATATPAKTAAQIGFAPWGNAGPGGQLAAAQAIVNGMKAAGYRLPADAPYSGAGSTVHGSPQQFMAALSFFGGKSRK